MWSYLLIFTGTLISSLLLTPLVRRQAIRWGVFDHPDAERRVHKTPMPRLGGIAIYLGLLLAWVVLVGLDRTWVSLWKLLLPATLIFVLGVADDVFGVSERWKLVVPAVSATLLHALGFRLASLSLLPGITFAIPSWLGFALLVIWLVGVTNAFNLIDGADGLAVGIGAIAVSAVLICSMLLAHRESGILCAMLLGALLGFLPYNFNPAAIFLGDSGSLLLGFLTAILALMGTGQRAGAVSIAAPVILGLPIAEAAVTLLRRWYAGQPLLPGDRGHFHHKLLARGLSQRQVVLRLYAVGAVLAVSGLILLKAGSGGTILLLILLGLGLVGGVRYLRYIGKMGGTNIT